MERTKHYGAEEQMSKPSGTVMSMAPNFIDFVESNLGHKYRVLEKEHERPANIYQFCDLEKFAYQLCARNMPRRYAKAACFKELEDIQECLYKDKQKERCMKLKKASRKIGDRVPELYGNMHWAH